MRKLLSVMAVLMLNGAIFANQYRIVSSEIVTSPGAIKLFGKTNPLAVELNVPLDKKRIFSSEEKLADYIRDYEKRLQNTRAFDEIKVDYVIHPTEDGSPYQVEIHTELKDTIHFIAIPYPSYDSNTGFKFKIKMKDTNFLGTMNEMNSEFIFGVNENGQSRVALAFSFDKPFYLNPFVLTWVNDYELSYTFGNSSPEWNLKTGAKLELPLDRISYNLEFYQYFIKNFDYADYDDTVYFTEQVRLSVPIDVYRTEHWGKFIYTPYVEGIFNWDNDGINDNNTDLSSPVLTVGQGLTCGRINWQNDFRAGFSSEIKNSFSYNFQRQMLYPFLSVETKAFNYLDFIEDKDNFDKIGLAADFYFCMNFENFIYPGNKYFANDGTAIGSRLRGIKDEIYYDDAAYGKVGTTPSAFVLNLDLPYHLFTTNFTGKFTKFLNFDFQISPFIDMALMYNKYTDQWYNPRDGLYAAGLEVLVYPLKWSSFTIRGSLGVDVGSLLLSNVLNMDWRQKSGGIIRYMEIFIGVGLLY